MGWAERANHDSKWNKRRIGKPVPPDAVKLASPITNAPNVSKAPIPAARQDEPMVIEINLRNLWGLLCRMLRKAPRQQSPALTS